jgi:hypothetical protein
MPRAVGARAQIVLAFESTRGRLHADAVWQRNVRRGPTAPVERVPRLWPRSAAADKCANGRRQSRRAARFESIYQGDRGLVISLAMVSAEEELPSRSTAWHRTRDSRRLAAPGPSVPAPMAIAASDPSHGRDRRRRRPSRSRWPRLPPSLTRSQHGGFPFPCVSPGVHDAHARSDEHPALA